MAPTAASKAFTAMVIDSNSIARHRLKQVCHSLEEFDHVDQSNDVRSAMTRIAGKLSRLDIIFISSDLPENEIKEFTDWAKALGVTEDTAFVILMGVNEKGEGADARAYLMGRDGVLFEPFSTDQLREICTLAMNVRKDRTAKRLAKHLQGMVNDIFGMLGDIAFLKESNFSFKPVINEMAKITSVIEGLEEEQAKIYYDALIDRSENRPDTPRKRPNHFRYPGKSKRARKRMQKKTLRALGYDATTE